MSTAEALYDRREFVSFFAGKKQAHGRHYPKKSSRPDAKPPKDGDGRFTRRKFLIGGAATLATGATALTRILEPWKWFISSEQTETGTLDSLITAKKMEKEFNGNDLSNESTINNFTAVLADVFSKDTKSSWTKEQISGSIIWTRNFDEFIKVVRLNSNPQRQEQTNTFKDDIAAVTTSNRKIVVNLTNPGFNTSILRRSGFPQDWNALKMLRRVLMHEFIHLTVNTKRDDEFLSLTDLSKDIIEDPIAEGFMILFKEQGKPKAIFHVLNELAIETITSERNSRLFGPTPPVVYIEDGINLVPAQQRLRQILDAAGIKITDLEKFHQSSDFYGFLTSLSSKIDFPAGTSLTNRINYILSVLDAVLYNNQNLIQEYITKTTMAKR